MICRFFQLHCRQRIEHVAWLAIAAANNRPNATMGVFDDSDDDSDNGESPAGRPGLLDLHGEFTSIGTTTTASAAPSSAAAPLPANRNNNKDENEEVDPLDAFMCGVQSEAKRDAEDTKRRAEAGDDVFASDGGAPPKRARLDVDNEEEATSHWTERPAPAAAASAAESNDTNHNKRLLPVDASLDDDEYNTTKALHQEIDPLAKVDHGSIQYKPFQRQFYETTSTMLGRQWRSDNDVSCSINTADPILSFNDLGPTVLHQEILEYLNTSGYKTPTLVQSQSLPVALSGRDCMVTASTGSGKTLSYAIPLTIHCIAQEHILAGVDGPIGLILTPTRELASQVHKQCDRLLKALGGRAICVTGGNKGTWELSKDLQRGCEVVVSTPGRLIDLVKAKAGTNLRRVTMIILDECDRILSMGFEKQVTSILANVRPDRQTLMFSATLGRRVEKVAKQWLSNPVRIAVGRTGMSSEHVSQHLLVLPSYNAKKQWIMEMTPTLANVGRMIVFVSSRADCEELATQMQRHPSIGGAGLLVDSIHGDKHQTDRNAALNALRKGKLAALIATDVAARGLDVEDIMTVVNFDPARNLDAHVHRVGRAGRLSTAQASGANAEQKKGVAYTLLTTKNADFANVLMNAFLREGRHVGDDLEKLARQSKHFRGGERN